MASTITLKINGLDELVRNANKVGGAMKQLLYQTMVKSVTIVKEDAKKIKSGSFKNQSGDLRRSIVGRAESAERGVVSTDIPYAEYVEYGTRPHTITPKSGNFLAWKGKSGKMVFARKVNHPGSKPYPYMQPALENNRDEIFKEYEAMGQIIVNELAK
jgi:HK97 gp10 family phage protein